MRRNSFLSTLALVLAFAAPSFADTTAHVLATSDFSQAWTDTGLITTSDSWTSVPSIVGYRGDGLTGATAVDPQTVLAANDPGVIDVNANQTAPNTNTTGGVTEFEITNPVVAFQGSGTARAPYLQIYLDTTGRQTITVAYNLRDIDGAADNSVQPVALHYRIGNSGAWTNVASAFVADASTGPSLATLSTAVSVILPAAVNNQPLVQLRIMTADAVGSDEWIGVDDISVTSVDMPNTLNIGDASVSEGNLGTVTASFTVSLTEPAPVGGVSFDIATADGTALVADSDYVAKSLTGQTISAGASTYTFDVLVNGDAAIESNELFYVNVTNVVGVVTGDTQGAGTILNDDSPPNLTINDVSAPEGNSGTTNFTFTVSLSSPAPAGGVTFDIATADNTAQDDNPVTEDNDYVAQSLTGQTIAAGGTTATFTVAVNGDTAFEANETFFVNVTNVTAANVTDGQGQGTITNDDTAPAFSIGDLATAEGDSGTSIMTFTVTASKTSGAAMTVDVATADSSATVAGGDYVAVATTTLTFAPGDTTKTVDVTINGDTTSEGDEQYFVNLTNATGGATISDNQALGIIRNEEPFSIGAVDTAYSDNMDLLSSAIGGSTPVAWTFSESGSSSNSTYGADTGSSNSGNTFSYGSAAAADRAFGGLQSGSLTPTIGAFYRNDTGTTITSLAVKYTGEEWRLGTAGRADRLDFQYSLDATSLTTGAWTNVDQLDFSTPNQLTTGAKDGNAAANRAGVVYNIPGLSIAPGATFWIRFSSWDASGADDGLAVDDFSITANYGGAFLAIDDASAFEGSGSTTFTFTVSLSAPAPVGGVTFDIATADGTATTANSDYAAINLVGETIPAGSSSKSYSITVNGDVTPEPTETFFVNVSNIVNALPQDPQGLGTIVDDDTPLTRIHDIQGNGATSPIVGSSVTIRGIVTGVKSSGFFVQEEDADADADPATSEGVLVYTGGNPPLAAAFGNLVQVSGTVAEYVPSADPQQPPLTEIASPTVVQLATNQTLPTAIPLSASFPDPSGAFDQLERVEGMRVSVASLTVTGPTDGSFNETAGTGTANGRFFGVVTGVARPFREAGIQAPDVPPGGVFPPLPRWDYNPERLKIESTTIGGALLTVRSNDTVGPIVGPLDYAFRAFAIYPDATATPVVTPGTLDAIATAPLGNEVTVASYNLQRLFDTVDDPNGDPVVTPTAYQNRLAKASKAIRDHLHFPDIIGVQEAEKLAVLQDLAAQISADAITNGQADPQYAAYLEEGNDIGGIDVGFLVKTAEVAAGLKRVSVASVTQFGKTTTWTDPSSNSAATLNDRPPLVLVATVNRLPGLSFDVTVVNNHLRSLNGVDSTAPDGLTTEGDRVRQKRQTQAVYLANLVQARQLADATERIVLVGDFNAFEVNDGYADLISTIIGTPTPDDQTVVPGDGADLVNPDLDPLDDTPPVADRYSYSFEGNAQSLDHAIVNQALVNTTTARRIEHPRINTDYPETERNDSTTAFRTSDHDPILAYFEVASLLVADFAVDKQHATGFATAGTTTSYTIVVSNDGPDSSNGSFSDVLPAGLTFVSLSSPAGWSCTTPSVGSGGAINCSTTSLMAVGSASFTLTVNVDGTVADGAVITNSVTALSAAYDPLPGNDGDSVDITVSKTPVISIGDSTVLEGSAGAVTPATFTVTLSTPRVSTVTVEATTAAGTAAASLDYTTTTQTITFLPGVVTQSFVVPVTDDVEVESSEAFFVNLSAPVNASLGDGQAIGTIVDDDEKLSAPDPLIISNCPPVIGGPCVLSVGSISGASQRYWYYAWTVNGVPAGTLPTLDLQLTGPGTYVVVVEVTGLDGQKGTATITITVADPCPAGRLCLQNGRFEVSLVATDHRTGATGDGVPLKENDHFGHFALPALTGNPNNPEVFVKIHDGRAVNGNFWVFYGGLTDLQYVITVVDKEAGTTKTYSKPGGSSAGGFDVGAGVTPEECAGEVDGVPGTPSIPGTCGEGTDRLCLLGGRFRITLTARDQRTGKTANGISIPQKDLFGYFSLPDLTGDATNPEVFVKLLDGTPVNGHNWIFYAGLTDLEYTITVFDVTTGGVKRYTKAPGSACGGFDTNGL